MGSLRLREARLDVQGDPKHYYKGISFTKVSNAAIRVRLRSGLSAVRLTCAADFTVRSGASKAGVPAGAVATVTYAGGKYEVSAAGRTHEFSSPVKFAPGRGSLRVLTASDLGHAGAYRGTIRVERSGSALMMINRVSLESYLRGVVPHALLLAERRPQGAVLRGARLRLSSAHPGSLMVSSTATCARRRIRASPSEIRALMLL